jgi:hypothetical protein
VPCLAFKKPPPERQRVLDGEALPVVVEVGEHLDGLAPRPHAGRPLAQLAIGVVAAVAAAAVVEAQVGPVRGHDLRRRLAPAAVVDDERGAVLAQQRPYRLGEPARVAQLERVPARREVGERVGEPVVVAAEGVGQLPQHRAELGRLDQRRDRLVVAPDPAVHVREPLHVGQVLARLDREDEVVRRVVDPAVDRRRLGQPVEGGVDLDGVELARVVLEPPPRRQARRVERLLPAGVVPA